ncbi:FecR family protein [Chryseolinea lacunae]|uniref:FecR domain-containing protein n=1 Tax=Chryseolinea lacunae TaxID=2801331 RepID=A0ABS1L236_9BACT|nr:FecR family protein [Chryseolinea lacunae]MBL0745786.1 FecR domain-containing protein [Chryseolinea lacunae]
MSRKEFEKILMKYQKGLCTAEEEALVQRWYDTIGEETNFSIDQAQHQQLENVLWQKLSLRIHEPVVPTPSRLYWKIASVAAALFICIGMGVYLATDNFAANEGDFAAVEGAEMIIVNDHPVAKAVTLEDGSVITLQPGSTLRMAKHFSKEKRELQLTGVAFFEVAHDKQRPFLVYTKNVITKVLGTSFSVYADKLDSSITVSVKTGRVSVSRQVEKHFGLTKTMKEEAILVPNQKAVFDLSKEKVTTTLVDNPQPVLAIEKEKVMTFDEKPVTDILKSLEKMYAVDIDYDASALQFCELTTVFSEEGLYERLRIICKAIEGTYEIHGTRIILKSRGCSH